MKAVLMWVYVAGIFAIAFIVRFSHPHLTETELMIAFWPWYLLAVALACGAVGLSRRS